MERTTEDWVGQLRDEDQVGIGARLGGNLVTIILNKNPKIKNSIVELFEAEFDNLFLVYQNYGFYYF